MTYFHKNPWWLLSYDKKVKCSNDFKCIFNLYIRPLLLVQNVLEKHLAINWHIANVQQHQGQMVYM